MNTFDLSEAYKIRLVDLIKEGVGILPTDTVYGLVASVNNIDSVNRLYKLKDREKKPGTIIAADVQQLLDLGVDDKYLSAAKQFWPGQVSVVIPACSDLGHLHQGINSLAFRVVADESVAKILRLTGPLVTSSANHPGKPVANTIDEAWDYFGDNVDFYIDGGNLSTRTSSAILRLDGSSTVIIRR